MRRILRLLLVLHALASNAADQASEPQLAPLATVLACGTFVPPQDVVRLLRSAYANLPHAQLLFALDKDSALALQPTFEAAPASISILVYDYHELEKSLPAYLSNYTVHVRRYHHYRIILRDAEAEGGFFGHSEGGSTSAAASTASSAPPWVLYRRAGASVAARTLPGRPTGGVLLSDLRDVVFQADPFALLQGAVEAAAAVHASTGSASPRKPLLVGAAERHGLVVKHCPFNSQWTRACYGDTGASFLAFSQVLCSGTTLGEAPAVSEYLDALVTAATGCASREWSHGVGSYSAVH